MISWFFQQAAIADPLFAGSPGPPAETLKSLAAFRAAAEQAGLLVAGDLPPWDRLDWSGLSDQLAQIDSGELGSEVSYDNWRRAVSLSARTSTDDGLAALIVSLFATAAFLRAYSRGDVVGSSEHPAWRALVVACIRRLVRLDALWAAKTLALALSDDLRGTTNYNAGRFGTRRAVALLLSIEAAADRAQRQQRVALAWSLHRLLDEELRVRGAFAGLMWTMGDVIQAHALGEGRYSLTRSAVTATVNMTLDQDSVDPFILAVWLQIMDAAGDKLGRHEGVVSRLRLNVNKALRLFVNDVTAMENVDLVNRYAAVVSSFFVGELESASVAAYENRYWSLAPPLQEAPSDILVRVSGLINLISQRSEEEKQEKWSWLAAESIAAISSESLKKGRRFHVPALNIPFYYLRGYRAGDLIAKIDLLEDFRNEAQGYWLTVTPPSRPAHLGRTSRRLVRREDQLLADLRDCRFFMLREDLPRAVSRYYYSTDGIEDVPSEQIQELLSSDIATDRFRDLVRELQGMWKGRVPKELRGYAKERTSTARLEDLRRLFS